VSDLSLTVNPNYCTTCGKVPYQSAKAARSAGRALRHEGFGALAPYYSAACGCWHLASRGRRKR
jgi:hypothetical protein